MEIQLPELPACHFAFRIVTNSTMWQSETWNRHIVNVLSDDEEHWRGSVSFFVGDGLAALAAAKAGQVAAPMAGAQRTSVFSHSGLHEAGQVVHQFFLPSPLLNRLRGC